MVYRVRIKPAAEKALSRLPTPYRRRMAAAIDSLAHDPRGPGARKLSARSDYWRLRVGDYRIVYEIADEVLLVYVVRVAHRREVYRGL